MNYKELNRACFYPQYCLRKWRRVGLMVSALDSGSSGPGSSPGRSHCVVFLGKTLYSHSASLHPGVRRGTSKNAGGNPERLKETVATAASLIDALWLS